MLDHIFVDVQTSMADPRKGEIISLAMVRTTSAGKPVASHSALIAPVGEVTAKEYDREKWIDAIPYGAAARAFENIILDGQFESKPIIVGHSADGHRAALRLAQDGLGKAEFFAGRAWACTSHMAWPLVYAGIVPSRSLEAVAKYFGVVNKAPNTTQGNVVACLETYWAMMRRYRTALTAENFIDTMGGDTVKHFRSMFGF
jgi:hypothetical protein